MPALVLATMANGMAAVPSAATAPAWLGQCTSTINDAMANAISPATGAPVPSHCRRGRTAPALGRYRRWAAGSVTATTIDHAVAPSATLTSSGPDATTSPTTRAAA